MGNGGTLSSAQRRGEEPTPQLSWQSALAWLAASLATVVIVAVLVMFVLPRAPSGWVSRLPFALRLLYSFALMLLTAKASFASAATFSKRGSTPPLLALVYRMDFWLSVFILSVVLLTTAVAFRVPIKTADLIHSAVPAFSRATRQLVGSVTSFLVSALLGGLVYDTIKRLTARAFKRFAGGRRIRRR
jgi:hypothetical protein